MANVLQELCVECCETQSFVLRLKGVRPRCVLLSTALQEGCDGGGG